MRKGSPAKGRPQRARHKQNDRPRRNVPEPIPTAGEPGDAGTAARADGPRDDVIAGRRAVKEAVRAGRPLHRLFLKRGMERRTAAELLTLARDADVPVHWVEEQRLAALAGDMHHQGVVAIALAKEYVSIHDVLERAAAQGREGLVLFLDGVQDPQNLGSLLRSADAAGAAGVVIPKRRAAGLTGAVSRASAGAVEYVPVARVANIVQAMERFKKEGFWLVGADADGPVTAWEADLAGPVGIVVGGEGKGLSRLVKERCDFVVRFPMKGNVESLNAGVAGALLLYEVMRQRWVGSEKPSTPVS